MEKLMVDTARALGERQYGVDGFRFDIMGHHMKANMEHVRDMLPRHQTRAIYLYGEGWNFGEMANNARGVNATQLNMAGTGIGTFNDRLRDAVRGGGPFDGGDDLVDNQGFISGLFYDPNAKNTAAPLKRINCCSLPTRFVSGWRATWPTISSSTVQVPLSRAPWSITMAARRLHARPARGNRLCRGA